jgi:hypothetical protein
LGLPNFVIQAAASDRVLAPELPKTAIRKLQRHRLRQAPSLPGNANPAWVSYRMTSNLALESVSITLRDLFLGW